MDQWIKDRIIAELGQDGYDALNRMLEKSATTKPSNLKNEIIKIIKEEVEDD